MIQPLLAEAAAQILHRTLKDPSKEIPLAVAAELASEPSADAGGDGELEMRVSLMLAYDCALRREVATESDDAPNLL